MLLLYTKLSVLIALVKNVNKEIDTPGILKCTECRDVDELAAFSNKLIVKEN